MRYSSGFSLVEVTVSIFILGVILLTLQAVLQSGALVRTTKNQGIALAIAKDQLETLRSGGYANLPASGSFSNSLLSSLPIATTTLAISTYNAGTKQVIVSVLWQEPSSPASSTLSLPTLITQTGGTP